MPARVTISGLATNVKSVLAARYYFRCATSVGARVRVYGRPAVKNEGVMRIGDRVRLLSTIATSQIEVGPEGELDIGDSVVMSFGCSIGVTKLIRIGARSRLGPYVMMMDSDFHCLEPERRLERPPSQPIILESDVWIGTRAMVLRGVTIGYGSVVGAGSLVIRDVPPRTLVAGMPAKVIRSF